MKAVCRHNIAGEEWLRDKALTQLFALLNKDGITARLVGGCVRDMLGGLRVGDIDVASSRTPEENQKILQAAKVKVVPTGIKHGTITAVIRSIPFEITTLRRDVTTDGRHAEVAYTDNWLEDAKRRDFTINALYMDLDGTLYDPFDGRGDLARGQVRFIGNAQDRIREDALRILRFFRFSAVIGAGDIDEAGLKAAVTEQNMIKNLSGERLAQEMIKILSSPHVVPIVRVMEQTGILAHVLGGAQNFKKFEFYTVREQALACTDVMGRLSCLTGNVAEIAKHLRLSKRQRKSLDAYVPDGNIEPAVSPKDMRRLIYTIGRDVFIHRLKRSVAIDQDMLARLIEAAESWPIPKFPLRGQDIIERGGTPGPGMGERLRKLEQIWIESDFTLSGEELL